jgi:hypothetical protein
MPERDPPRPKIFAEPPEDLDETWRHGFVVGGMAHQTELWELARAYHRAGNLVVEHALDHGEAWEISYPVLYLYRHMIELYIEAIVPARGRRTHNLLSLITRFVSHVPWTLNEDVPDWFRDYLLEFASFDPDAQAFRFTDADARKPLAGGTEGWVDLAHLRNVMDTLSDGFENVLTSLSRPAAELNGGGPRLPIGSFGRRLGSGAV